MTYDIHVHVAKLNVTHPVVGDGVVVLAADHAVHARRTRRATTLLQSPTSTAATPLALRPRR